MNKDFWKDKKVLITGHNGFKGLWLTKWLDMAGARVLGISLQPEEGSGISSLTFSQNYQNVNEDIRENKFWAKLREFQPEIVLHLAAQAIVKVAKDNPLETFEVNVMGTANLLEGLRYIDSVKSIVVVTSDKVYENRETMVPYHEGNPLMGSEPYSCSKVAQEQVAKAYFDSYFKDKGVGMASARASNAFGGGDFHFDRLIPYLEKCAFEGIVPEIRNPHSVRPWQYVLDLLNGYLMLAESLYETPNSCMEYFNFGPNQSELYTVGEMADIICKSTDVRSEKQDYYEAGLLLLDSEKSRDKLGWSPLYNTTDGLIQTNIAYKDYFENGCSDKMYEERIKDFMRRQSYE